MPCSRCFRDNRSTASRGWSGSVAGGLATLFTQLLRWSFRLIYAIGVGFSAGIRAMMASQPQPVPTALPVARPVRRLPNTPKEPLRRPTVMDQPKSGCKNATGKRIGWILVIGMIAAGVVSMATSKSERYIAPPPAQESLSRLSPRKLQMIASESAVVAGAQAGRSELVSKFGANSPQYIAVTNPNASIDSMPAKPNTVRLIRVRSDAPHVDVSQAQKDALRVAQLQLAEQLRNLEPPIETVPSVDVIRQEYLKPNSFTTVQPTEEDRRLWAENKLEVNRVWAEIELVEVSAEQLRQLRSTERLERSGWWAGMALVVLAALYGFLRFDAWTRGYLTMALGLGFAAIAGGAVALLFWMR